MTIHTMVAALRCWDVADTAQNSGASPSECACLWKRAAFAYMMLTRETPMMFDTSRGMYTLSALRAARKAGDMDLFDEIVREFTGPDASIASHPAQNIADLIAEVRGATS